MCVSEVPRFNQPANVEISSKNSIICLITTAQTFLGSSLSLQTVGWQIPCEHEHFLFAAAFSLFEGTMEVTEDSYKAKKLISCLQLLKLSFWSPSLTQPPFFIQEVLV